MIEIGLMVVMVLWIASVEMRIAPLIKNQTMIRQNAGAQIEINKNTLESIRNISDTINVQGERINRIHRMAAPK